MRFSYSSGDTAHCHVIAPHRACRTELSAKVRAVGGRGREREREGAISALCYNNGKRQTEQE